MAPKTEKRGARLTLIVPIVLAVTVATLAVSAISSVGCGSGSSPDANLGDGGRDAPLV